VSRQIFACDEVVQLDMHLKDGKVETCRAKVKVSFKYQG
jgi:flavin-binding protein dodecin